MKTYQAILLHLLLAVGAVLVPTIKNPTLQLAVGAAVASSTAAVAKANSDSNPDGTSARGAYAPEGK